MISSFSNDFRKSLKKREREMPSFEKALTPETFWYTDPSFLDFEKEAVFKKSWQFAGRVDQLVEKGDYFSGELFHLYSR